MSALREMSFPGAAPLYPYREENKLKTERGSRGEDEQEEDGCSSKYHSRDHCISRRVLGAGTWYSYNVTVPKFAGSTSTNNITKQYNGDASVHSQSIGASYKLDVRLEKVDNSSASVWKEIDDSTRVWLPTSVAAGNQVHVRFKTKWSTPVDVQAQGCWSPDNPNNNCF